MEIKEQIELVSKNPLNIEKIENPDEQVCMLAVKALWNSLKLIENPSYNVIKEAVETKGWAIQFVKEKTLELNLIAVSKDYDAIKYIEEPSEEVQLKAIENYWGAIKFIKNPTLNAMRLAIKLNEESVNFISRYDYDDMKYFIFDNVSCLKYLYESMDIDIILSVLEEKLKDENIEDKYVKDFLNLEVLEMDKIKFIKENGSKKCKKILVDYNLSL